MSTKTHLRMTASEIAMGRFMRAPDHPPADDEFSAAFADLSKEDPPAGAGGEAGGSGDGGGDAGAAAAGSKPTGDAGADGAGDAGGDGGDPPAGDGLPTPESVAAAAKAGAGGEPPAAGAPGEPKLDADGKPVVEAKPAAAPAAGDTDDVLARLAAAIKATPPAKDEPPAAAEEQPLFSAEEEQKLEHFKKEWPEVAEAFDLQSRALAASVLKYAFGQIAEQFIPMREKVELLAGRTHRGDLTAQIGEYTDAEVDAVEAWVAEQPKYLQTAMLGVINEGTADEVADLVNRYREATGKPKAGAPAAEAGAPGGDAELSSEAKQAAAALAPVGSKRSVVTQPEDTSDFDGAFVKFADQI